jgi:hypothetical protein
MKIQIEIEIVIPNNIYLIKKGSHCGVDWHYNNHLALHLAKFRASYAILRRFQSYDFKIDFEHGCL